MYKAQDNRVLTGKERVSRERSISVASKKQQVVSRKQRTHTDYSQDSHTDRFDAQNDRYHT